MAPAECGRKKNSTWYISTQVSFSLFVPNSCREPLIFTLNHTLDRLVFIFNFNSRLMSERQLNAQVSERITGGLLHTVSHTFLWLTK